MVGVASIDDADTNGNCDGCVDNNGYWLETAISEIVTFEINVSLIAITPNWWDNSIKADEKSPDLTRL